MASYGAAAAHPVEMELAWHLLTVLVRLGRAASASDLAAAAATVSLSVSPDIVERTCRIPESPLRISGGGVVTISETAVVTFLRFLGWEVPAQRVRLRPPEERRWRGEVYERKRKVSDASCLSGKRRRLLAPDAGCLISKRRQIFLFTFFYCMYAGSVELSVFLYSFGPFCADLMEHSEHQSNQLVAQICAPAATGEV
jgi:cell division control protein 7